MNDKEELERLKEENLKLKKDIKKLNSRLDSIMKMGDSTFRNIFEKNINLEKTLNRFDKILHQSDKQGKTIIVQKDLQEELIHSQNKMAAMGELIDDIAHQWRQPLSLITTQASTILGKKECDLIDEETEFEYLENIIQTSKYLSITIDDFRNFLKEDKELTSFDLKSTFDKLELISKGIITSNNIKLNIECNNIQVLGIENELIQVLMNLILNSNDAFENDSKNKIIKIRVKKDLDSKIVIYFQDNANGINEEIQNKIFKSGFTTKHELGGTGVGLYMCKSIIESTFSGKICVENKPLKYENMEYFGALFTLSLNAINDTKSN